MDASVSIIFESSVFIYFFGLTALLNAAVAFYLGVSVFVYDRHARVNQLFALMSLSIVLWSVSNGLWHFSQYEQQAIFWVRGLIFGSTFIPVFFLHWVVKLTGRRHAKGLVAAYALTAIFFFFSFTPYYFHGVSQISIFPYWPNGTPLYFLYILFAYVGIIGDALILLVKTYRATESDRLKMQLKFVFVGALLAAAGGATNFFLWFDVVVWPWGNILVALYVILYAYSMVNHELMNIRVVVNKSLVYSILFILFSSFVGFFAFLFGNYIKDASANVFLAATAVALLMAIAFPAIRRVVQTIMDRIIQRPNANYPKMLMVAEYALARCETVYGLAQETQETIRESLHADSTLFVLNRFTHFFESGTPAARPLTRGQTNTLITFFRESDDFVLADDIERLAIKHPYAQNLLAEIKRLMQSRHIAVIIPLKGDGGLLIGFLAVAEKANGWYAREDVAFLRSFGEQLVTRFNIVVNDEQATKRMMHILKTMNK